MIINFIDEDGNGVCISDCVKFYTDKERSNVYVERRNAEGTYLDKYHFSLSTRVGICYEEMLESAKEWAKIQSGRIE